MTNAQKMAELAAENERLKHAMEAMAALEEENGKLKNRMEEAKKFFRFQREEIEALKAENAALKAENAELKEELEDVQEYVEEGEEVCTLWEVAKDAGISLDGPEGLILKTHAARNMEVMGTKMVTKKDTRGLKPRYGKFPANLYKKSQVEAYFAGYLSNK